jgi:predicted amidophosphoribosyltransferase
MSHDKHKMGSGGRCVCPKCGQAIAHRSGIPCREERCPACGAKMLREGSYHHRLFEQKQAEKRAKTPDVSGDEAPS